MGGTDPEGAISQDNATSLTDSCTCETNSREKERENERELEGGLGSMSLWCRKLEQVIGHKQCTNDPDNLII